MEAKSRTTRTYSLTDLTEEEASDLLELCVGDHVKLDIREPRIETTIQQLRETLLSAGVKRGEYNGEETTPNRNTD